MIKTGLLQNRLTEVRCAVLNYINDKIEIDEFSSEAMYDNFLSGVNCRKGMGLYDNNEVLELNKLNDGVLIIVLHNGTQTAKYQYTTIFEAAIEFRRKNISDNNSKRITFKIRKNRFCGIFTFIDNVGNSMEFDSIEDIKSYVNQTYNEIRPIDWNTR